MEALEAILTRRSVAKVSTQRPSRDEVLRLLEAAVRAPTHYLTEPWRFIVLTDGALDDLGDAMADRLAREQPDAPDLGVKMEFERRRPHRAPVIVTLVYVPGRNAKAIDAEDRYSMGAAMQNLLVAAHATGLAAYIRTGPAAVAPAVHEMLGLRKDEEIAGFVYLGYPSERPPPRTRRTPPSKRTTWLGWGD